MESIGLNNLATVSYSYIHHACPSWCRALYWTEPRPLCEFCWLPFKLWLKSQMWKKLVVDWLRFKKSEYVKMAVISPVTLFCPKPPMKNLKQLKITSR